MELEQLRLERDLFTFSSLNAHEGVIHATTTRNFWRGSFDKRAMLERVAAVLELEPRLIACGRQVHETKLVNVTLEEGERRGFVEFPETDALTTFEPFVLLAVFTADCLPVLIVDPATPRIAVVHAGWRGTLSRVLAKTIQRLAELGSDPAELGVWLGPAIGQANYEVSTELADRFRAEFPGCPEAMEGRLLDLTRLNAHQAEACGVPAPRIRAAGVCTYADTVHCESYRRDGDASGRTASFLMLKSAPHR